MRPARWRVFVIRFSGDEAAVGLSFAQFAAYGLNAIVDIFYATCSNLVARLAKFSGREFPELFFLVLLCSWLVFSPTIVGYNLSLAQAVDTAKSLGLEIKEQIKEDLVKDLAHFEELQKYIVKTESLFTREGENFDRAMLPPDERRELEAQLKPAEAALYFLRDEIERKEEQLKQDLIDDATIWKFYSIRLLKIISTLAFNVVGGAMVLILMIYLGLRSFGSRELAEILYVDHSVEVLPHGDHKLIHLDWKQVKTGLLHTRIHSSPAALQAVARWVGDRV
jgi:hypothetical protein